jgi:hypothetical protein
MYFLHLFLYLEQQVMSIDGGSEYSSMNLIFLQKQESGSLLRLRSHKRSAKDEVLKKRSTAVTIGRLAEFVSFDNNLRNK